MSGYCAPADVWVSCDWQCHRDRPDGGSPEPGTDFATAYGTSVRMAGDGTVSVIDYNNGGGEGRRLTVDLDDGRQVSYLHLSRINAFMGQRVAWGQTDVIWSGASGYGNDWYYGPHVHVTLHEHPGMPYKDSIDFEKYVGAPDPPPPETPAAKKRRQHKMPYSLVPLEDGGIYLLSLVTGNRAHISEPSHIGLLQRALVDNSDDLMLSGEIDIVNNYLDQINPPGAPVAEYAWITPARIAGVILAIIGVLAIARVILDPLRR